tara:strand:+ start:945 stop:2183 length:1239 start_codon:yes stop_codon:yes gene_type:complete
MTISETFCVLPWLHLHFHPNGQVHHCCLSFKESPMGNLMDGSPDEIINNENFKKLRLQLLNNEKPYSCTRCFEREQYNVTSMRQHHNQHFSKDIPQLIDDTNTDGSLNKVNFKYWDFRFSNLCNMKCRMCGSVFSSLWYDDEIELKRRGRGSVSVEKRVVNSQEKSQVNLKEWVDNKIEDVEYCYFAGGEPLIMEEHYYILKKLIEHKRFDVKIRYNSNLLKLHFRDFDLVELWRKFDTVQMNASIDDIELRAEYIRKGTRWNEIEENIKRLQDTNIIFQIECTTQAMNVLTLPELLTRLNQLGVESYSVQFHNLLQYPRSFTVKILSDELKQQVEQKLANYITTQPEHIQNNLKPKFQTIIDYMNDMQNFDDVEDLRRQFKLRQNALDDIRQEKFTTVFPHLKEWYDAIPV